MDCPRCENVLLSEREREGVTVDVCTRCRGIWLDRGELEKLIARSREEEADFERDRRRPPERPRRDDDEDDRRTWERERDGGHAADPRHGYRRKKSWFQSLGDIFD